MQGHTRARHVIAKIPARPDPAHPHPMSTGDAHLEIVQIDSGLEFERRDESAVRMIFDVGGSSFLASYSRGNRPPSAPASSRTLGNELLADIIGPHTVISKLSEVDASFAVIRLLPYSEDAVSRWRSLMSSLHAQAIESIEHEGVLCESWFSFCIDDRAFLFAVMVRPSGVQVATKDQTPDLEIDRHHGTFKNSWDRTLRIACRPLVMRERIQD